MQKVWRVRDPGAGTVHVDGMHPIAGILLTQRGIETKEDARAFFEPNWETDTHDPFLFLRMMDAVTRAFQALQNGERITVHGDYDADGVTGSTVVITALRMIAELVDSDPSLIDHYIPHRDEEGYGLHMDTVPTLKDRGTSLLITVDCGITCVDEIAFAKEKGIDTIVLDHHRFGDVLPDAILIHPSVPDETYPFKDLAAVGVSWKFASALFAHARELGLEVKEGVEKWLLDLVAIATVTDMVPLHGENRTLLHYGLIVLNKTQRPGLMALIEASRLRSGAITSESIGFTIGPRINAAGRMEHAEHALALLLSGSTIEAKEMATRLEALNRLRQTRTREMMKTVDERLNGTEPDAVVALHDAEWSPALVGLVAGRVADRYARPCVAIGKHGSTWIGSGRSPDPINITELVREAGENLLTRVGGHAQACGFALPSDEATASFIIRLGEMGVTIHDQLSTGSVLDIAAEIGLSDITWGLWNTLQRFEPFGMANPRPSFVTRALQVVSADRVGKQNAHLRLVLTDDNGRSKPFIAFRLGDRVDDAPLGSRIDVVYDVETNEWNGRVDLSCRVIDFQPS